MQKAVVCVSKGKVSVRDIPTPTPGAGEVLIRVRAAGLNHLDWKLLDGLRPGASIPVDYVMGEDVAGEVEELGHGVSGWRIGDRVAAMVVKGGALAERVVVDAKLLIELPNWMPFANAGGLAVCALTACQMLDQTLKLSLLTPTSTAMPIPLLVWGAGSVTGRYVVQLATVARLNIIATASPRSHDKLAALGAMAVFDYADPKTPTKIREMTGGELSHAAAAMVGPGGYDAIAACMSDEGGTVSVINHDAPETLRDGKVMLTFSTGLTLGGKALGEPIPVPNVPEHYAAGQGYVKLLSQLLREGKLELPPVKTFDGLESAAEGLEMMRRGHVSGETAVVTLA